MSTGYRSSEAAERQEGHRGASVWGLDETASAGTSTAEAVPRRERYTQKGHSPASAVSENCWDKCVLPLEWVARTGANHRALPRPVPSTHSHLPLGLLRSLAPAQSSL